MKAAYKITNRQKFYQVADIDLSGLTASNHYNGNYNQFAARGTIHIELQDGETIESWGEHGENDFEGLGFKLECIED